MMRHETRERVCAIGLALIALPFFIGLVMIGKSNVAQIRSLPVAVRVIGVDASSGDIHYLMSNGTHAWASQIGVQE